MLIYDIGQEFNKIYRF